MADPKLPEQMATFGVYYGKKIDTRWMLRATDSDSRKDTEIVEAATFYLSIPYQFQGSTHAPIDCREIEVIRKKLLATLAGLKRDFGHKTITSHESKNNSGSPFFSQRAMSALLCLRGSQNACHEYSKNELMSDQQKPKTPTESERSQIEPSTGYLGTFPKIHLLETILDLPLTPKPKGLQRFPIGAIHLFRVRRRDVPILFLRRPDLCRER